MTGLERLTMLLNEEQARAVRIGYALGYRHGSSFADADLDMEAGPEIRALDDLGIE